MVRAKFRVLGLTQRYSHTDADGKDVFYWDVRLAPVLANGKRGGGDCAENKTFYAATPGGEIKMEMVSKETSEAFVPGQAYYIDFTPADG